MKLKLTQNKSNFNFMPSNPLVVCFIFHHLLCFLSKIIIFHEKLLHTINFWTKKGNEKLQSKSHLKSFIHFVYNFFNQHRFLLECFFFAYISFVCVCFFLLLSKNATMCITRSALHMQIHKAYTKYY